MESPAETKEDEKGSLVVGGVDAAAAYMAPAYPLDDPYGYPAIEVDVGLMLNCKKMGLLTFENYPCDLTRKIRTYLIVSHAS